MLQKLAESTPQSAASQMRGKGVPMVGTEQHSASPAAFCLSMCTSDILGEELRHVQRRIQHERNREQEQALARQRGLARHD